MLPARQTGFSATWHWQLAAFRESSINDKHPQHDNLIDSHGLPSCKECGRYVQPPAALIVAIDPRTHPLQAPHVSAQRSLSAPCPPSLPPFATTRTCPRRTPRRRLSRCSTPSPSPETAPSPRPLFSLPVPVLVSRLSATSSTLSTRSQLSPCRC